MAQVTGDKTLPSEVIQQIVTKTDGVPLFVEELTKMVLESAWFEQWECQSGGAGPVAPPGALLPLAIPATLHDSLMARWIVCPRQRGGATGRDAGADVYL